mgnify:CR=1 FL=1
MLLPIEQETLRVLILLGSRTTASHTAAERAALRQALAAFKASLEPPASDVPSAQYCGIPDVPAAPGGREEIDR